MLHVMSMMRDITLTNEELSHVIAKCLRQLTELELNELPPLIYQLLLLSAKVGCTKSYHQQNCGNPLICTKNLIMCYLEIIIVFAVTVLI